MAGLLSGDEIMKALLDPGSREQWLEIFTEQEFGKLPAGKGLWIEPFSKGSVGPVSYDLTVGKEIYSLRKAEKISIGPEVDSVRIEPGETVLVLTNEFVALGPRYAGVTLSRARIMNEGVGLSSAKVDPTWYGCLQIPVTNNSRRAYNLRKGASFCTLLIFELGTEIPKAQYLSKELTQHLGQRSLNYEPMNAVPWEAKRPDTVREEDMDAVVAFGPPFDVVRGMFTYTLKQIIDYMEKQWGTNALRQLKHSA